jgi:hypothetical protein
MKDKHAARSTGHQAAIEALARETQSEPAYVRQLYDEALAKLEAHAKVHSYLGVLASRDVRRTLHAAREKKPH